MTSIVFRRTYHGARIPIEGPGRSKKGLLSACPICEAAINVMCWKVTGGRHKGKDIGGGRRRHRKTFHPARLKQAGLLCTH
jgi:hypothetical protein